MKQHKDNFTLAKYRNHPCCLEVPLSNLIKVFGTVSVVKTQFVVVSPAWLPARRVAAWSATMVVFASEWVYSFG